MAIDRQLTNVLLECVHSIGTEFDLHDALHRLVESAVDIMPVTGAGVTLISAGVAPRPYVASDDRAMEFETLQSSLGEGPCVSAWETGEAVVIPDLGEAEQFPSFASSAFEAGLKAVFTFPLSGIGGQMGALDLYRDRPGLLTDDWIAVAETLADVASAYLIGAGEHVHPNEPPIPAALHHGLTGLPNRALLLDRLEQTCLRSEYTRRASAVFVVDLYPSEVVEPIQEWRVPDELMVEVARRLIRMSRPGDTVAHLADHQFVIVCEGLHKPADADAFAARVESGMQCPFFASGYETQISALVSVAFADGQCSAAELLARHTRGGEPESKHGGDNLNRYGKLRGQPCVDRPTDLDRDLQGAAGRGELFIHYQPIIDAADGGIVAVEALLRWLHPTVGLVEPTAFIPVAEHSGLMVEIGQWVLEQALSAARSWQSFGQNGGPGVAVNVSAYQLRSAGFVEAVENVLRVSRTDPRLLTLEVTESASVSDAAIGILADLKDLDVKLALDDFGTGYSSLADIARFPIDIIKIDRTFVAGMGDGAASSKIVGSVIELAHALGMIVVAEGVETERQLLELAKLSCDAYQGFYFSPAMSATRLEALCLPSGISSFRSMLASPSPES